MKYNTTFLDTYKKYISKGWYGEAISSATLERWSQNFSAAPQSPKEDFDPQICAHFLLHSLVFYQERHLEAIIVSIVEKLKSQLNQSKEKDLGHRLSEKELEIAWNKYKQESCIIAAAIPTAVGDSAHQACRLWRNISHIKLYAVSQLLDAIEDGKKHIIFVDDFIGTGTKIGNFLTETIIELERSCSFRSVEEVINAYHSSVDFNIAVFASHTKGYERLSQAFSAVRFYFGDLYTEEYDLLSEQCMLYEIFSEYKADIIAYLSEKQQELDADNPYALNLPISFSYGCPNNTLSLYYKTSSEWIRLLTEGHPPIFKSEV